MTDRNASSAAPYMFWIEVETLHAQMDTWTWLLMFDMVIGILMLSKPLL